MMAAMKSASLAILLGLAAGGAHAQMHLCTDANGRKTFSDVPCGPNAKQITVAPSSGGGSINPALAISTEHYEIRGTSWEELRREIDAKGPRGWTGMASGRLGYDLKT